MLELRPTCENCNRALPPASLEARICTYECTFCADCVDGLLCNVCPNCGGGFMPRPIRPATNWKNDNFLGKETFFSCFLGFFAWFNLITRPLWNRRARVLQSK
jgi:hypothetical protein